MIDERERIDFETSYVLAEVFPARIEAPAGMRRCSQCGSQSQALSAWKLTVIKHRHDTQPLGHLRLYCGEHLAGAVEWRSGLSGAGGKTGPVCPNCFLTVPVGTGVCDTCGASVE
jgi:hypothetical protein